MDMHLINNPRFYPNACICRTNAGANAPYVDTGAEIAGAHIYICKRCLTQMAEKFEWVHVSERDNLSRRAGTAEARILEVEAEAAAAARQIIELRTGKADAEIGQANAEAIRDAALGQLQETQRQLREGDRPTATLDLTAAR